MPTKRNRADQQQPYVPAGNGDASGEYADHDSGSNKHFTNFKKPEEIVDLKNINNYEESVKKITDFIKESDVKSKSKGGIYINNDYERIEALHNSDVIKKKESVIKMANAYDRQAKEGNPYFIVNDGFFSHGSCYYSGKEKGIVITPATFFKDTSTGYGTTWFHENGHLLDNTFVDEKGERGNYSVNYVSKKYNKTLKEVLDEEFATYFTKERKQELIDRIEKTREEVYAENGFNIKEVEEQISRLKEQIKPFKDNYNGLKKQIDDLYKENKIDYWQYLSGMSKAKAKYKREVFSLEKEIENLLPKKKKADIEQKVATKIYQKYSTITDMYSSLGKGRLHPEYGGYHDRNYWKTEDSKRVKEFFAEAFGGYTLENNHYEELKRAFPKSIEIFEEIYKEIK